MELLFLMVLDPECIVDQQRLLRQNIFGQWAGAQPLLRLWSGSDPRQSRLQPAVGVPWGSGCASGSNFPLSYTRMGTKCLALRKGNGKAYDSPCSKPTGYWLSATLRQISFSK